MKEIVTPGTETRAGRPAGVGHAGRGLAVEVAAMTLRQAVPGVGCVVVGGNSKKKSVRRTEEIVVSAPTEEATGAEEAATASRARVAGRLRLPNRNGGRREALTAWSVDAAELVVLPEIGAAVHVLHRTRPTQNRTRPTRSLTSRWPPRLRKRRRRLRKRLRGAELRAGKRLRRKSKSTRTRP